MWGGVNETRYYVISLYSIPFQCTCSSMSGLRSVQKSDLSLPPPHWGNPLEKTWKLIFWCLSVYAFMLFNQSWDLWAAWQTIFFLIHCLLYLFMLLLIDFFQAHSAMTEFQLSTNGFASYCTEGFPSGSDGKESTCNVGELGLIPGLGRSPGEANSYPLQYSGLENFMDSIVHGIAKSWTQLRGFHFL